MSFIAQLEPDALVAAFLDHPPDGFGVERRVHGMPCFAAPFDVLTSADDAFVRRLAALPFQRRLRRALTWRTRFAGSTVSEYALLPRAVGAAELVRDLVAAYGRECRLFIVKDLAQASPLLTAAENARALEFAAACRDAGFVLLEGQALAWVAIDFASRDEYLARLSSGRRKNIRRKLRSEAGLECGVLHTGDPCFRDPAVFAEFHALFEAVYAQSGIHFDHPSAAFFRTLLGDAAAGGVVFTYRHGGKLIGWNLCYEYGGKLVDKYIGLAYPESREQNLYFVSWMRNLDYAREHGLTHYVAGWTDPEVKRFLGACLTFTRHAVYARHPLLRWLLRRMAGHFEADRSRLAAEGVAP